MEHQRDSGGKWGRASPCPADPGPHGAPQRAPITSAGGREGTEGGHCPRLGSPARPGRPSHPGRPGERRQWEVTELSPSPGPGLPQPVAPHSPSPRAVRPPPAPRPGPVPPGCPACQAPPAARVDPRGPARPQPGQWDPGGRGHLGPLCHLWVLAHRGSLKSPARKKNKNKITTSQDRLGLRASREGGRKAMNLGTARGWGGAHRGPRSPAALTSRPGGPLSPGSPRLPFCPRSRSATGRKESELPS